MSKIKIEVSARHCHLSREHLDRLFGAGFKLEKMKPLSQEGEFASQATLTLKTKDGQIDNLRVVGPARARTQIELTKTDAHKLKIKPPLRLSGDIKGSAGGTLVGPQGRVNLKEGIIIAQRHIHADPATAKKLKLSERQPVSVKTFGDRSVVFNDVAVRIADNFVLRFHVDTDEGNAALPDDICGEGELII